MPALVAGCRAVRLSSLGVADRAGAGKLAACAGGRDGGRQSHEGRSGGRAGSGWVAQSSAATAVDRLGSPIHGFLFYFSCSINEGGQDNCLRSLLINCGLPLEAIAFARL